MTQPVAFVTGSSHGIGKGIALSLAQDGYRVIVQCHKDKNAARDVANEIETMGGGNCIVQGDVADPTVTQGWITEIINSFARIDVLVANAGIYERRTFAALDQQTWQRTIDVNMTGVFNCCKEVVPVMQQQRSGNIVIISSQLGFIASARGAHYTASKAGVIGFMRSLALELAPEGIRVNAVAPGMVDQTAILDIYSDEEKNHRAESIPVGRLGLPSDIGNTVSFLVSNKASYITGQTLQVNGGYFIP